MTWQKCPVCMGTGFVPHSGYMNMECPTCHAHGIISEISGSPPPFQKYVSSSSASIDLSPYEIKTSDGKKI